MSPTRAGMARRRRDRGALRGTRVAVALLVLAGTPPACGGGDGGAPPDGVAGAESQELTEQLAAEAVRRETRAVGLWKAGLSYPQRVSGAVGVLVARVPESYDCVTTCKYRGLTLQAEPGLAGGRLKLGYAVVFGEKRGYRFFLRNVFTAYGIKASVMRTWSGSPLEPERQTLVGVEGDITMVNVNLNLGLFRHVSGGRPEDEWVVAGGLAWGF